MTCEISIKTFDELTSVDLYHILKARSQVFVVEQNCPYQDMDEVDFDCLHLVAHQNEQLIGYCRIIPPVFNSKKSVVTPSGPIPSIGRVLVLAAHRGDGVARQMMLDAIKYCRKKYGKKPIIISAQTYLLHFYHSLGFITEGEPYFEDGIEHVIMVLPIIKKVKVKKESSGATNSILSFLLLMLALLFIIGLLYLMV